MNSLCLQLNSKSNSEGMKSKIQLFLEDTAQSALSVAKVLIASKFRSPLPSKTNKNCIILANGPSLRGSLQAHHSVLDKRKYDFFCVNFFANSDFYEQTQPNYYMMIAPEYWVSEFADIEDVIRKREELFEHIKAKTTWDLTIFIPWEAKKTDVWKGLFQDKPNIKVCYFNRTPVEGMTGINHFLFRNHLGMPRPHNVLLPSIWTGINMGYENIYIFGADHSWLPEISVTENNEVLLHNKHFYDRNSSTAKKVLKASGYRKLYELLEKFVLTFKGYFILKDYAATKEIKIWNSTPKSFIDAFDRKIPVR